MPVINAENKFIRHKLNQQWFYDVAVVMPLTSELILLEKDCMEAVNKTNSIHLDLEIERLRLIEYTLEELMICVRRKREKKENAQ
jgi:hypothetical protein